VTAHFNPNAMGAILYLCKLVGCVQFHKKLFLKYFRQGSLFGLRGYGAVRFVTLAQQQPAAASSSQQQPAEAQKLKAQKHNY